MNVTFRQCCCSFVGVSVFVLVKPTTGWPTNRACCVECCLFLLTVVVVLNVVGLGVGKWINRYWCHRNVCRRRRSLMGLGIIVWSKFWNDCDFGQIFKFQRIPRFVDSFGRDFLFWLVGLELASVIGRRDSGSRSKTLPEPWRWAGFSSGALYVRRR